MNIHGVNYVRQTELHTLEPVLAESSAFEVEMATEKLKRHKSPCMDQIPAELTKARGRTICCDICKLINSVWSKEELPEERKGSIIVPIYMKGDKTDLIIIEAHHLGQVYTQFNPLPAVKVNPIYRQNFWGSSVWILTQKVIYSAFVKYLRKMGIQ